MWDRKQLKAKGKAAFKANYWKCVIVALILAIFVGGAAATGGDSVNDAAEESGVSLTETLENAPQEFINILAATAVTVTLIGAAIKLLLVNPLAVGGKRFFVVNSGAPAGLDEVLHGFKNGYGRVVVGMLLRDLFTALWLCLLVIPGIIKIYSYRMVPYILADDPDIGGMEAIKRSKEMMKGQKWKTFVLDVSFFGWYIVATVTAGIGGLLWTNPYVEATGAELYKALKNA